MNLVIMIKTTPAVSDCRGFSANRANRCLVLIRYTGK